MAIYVPQPAVPASPATDTANIQGALDVARAGGDEVVLSGRGVYLVNQPLVLGGGDNAAKTVSLRGDGTAGLCWVGALDGTLLSVDHEKFFSIKNIGMQAPVKGTSRGIVFGRSGGLWNGMMTNGGRIEQVGLDNFATGVQIGQNVTGAAASELVFSSLRVNRSDVSILAEGYNTLDLRFEMLQMSNGGIGLKATQAASISVDGGGSAGMSVADFQVETGGVYKIGGGYRSECQRRFLLMNATTSAFTSVVLDAVHVAGSTDPDRIQVELRGCFALTALGSVFDGKFGVKNCPHGNSLALLNCAIGDAAVFVPCGGTLDQLRYSITGCKRLDGPWVVGDIPNAQGWCDASNQRHSDWATLP